MNYENLHKLIDRYEENIYYLNNETNDEKFKWHAVQQFQDAWFAPESQNMPFSEMFNRAQKASAVLVNNSTVQPANGIVKLAEKAPEEVERLFREVLFADDDDDIDLRQDHMEEFLDGMEVLLQQYYPASWKYRQDRHAASCYQLCMHLKRTTFTNTVPLKLLPDTSNLGKILVVVILLKCLTTTS